MALPTTRPRWGRFAKTEGPVFARAAAGPAAGAFAQRATPSLVAGVVCVTLLLAAALAAPWLAPYAPDQVLAGPRLTPPGAVHPFGTDALGRDVFSRVLHGARLAVGIALAGISLSALLGVAPGLAAGYRGGWLDQTLSRVMEVWLAFPGLLLALIIVARLGPSLSNTVLALGVLGAPGFFRLARGLTLSARQTLYVEAALALGAPHRRILLRHVLPNISSALVVLATLRSGMMLLATGGLSFVGLGAQPPLPEWGAQLAAGRAYLETAPWLVLYPGLCLTLTVVGLNLLGDGLRDWLDPRLRMLRRSI